MIQLQLIFSHWLELLAINIRNNKDIKGLSINDTTIKLSMYADDMTGLVIGQESIIELMKLYIGRIQNSVWFRG